MRRLLGTAVLAVAFPMPAMAEEAKPPKEREYSYTWELVDNSVVRPLTRVFDPALLIRKVANSPREAANVDENDQMRLPSTWWQPRLGFKPVTVEQMLKGPGEGKGPAPGRWTVTKAKTQGITPGFQMKDSNKDRFFIKFDPPDYPEITTAPDVIGCHLFWAAGYNVPENTIAFFHPESLDVDPEATYLDMAGNEKHFSREHLDRVLSRVARRRDGTFRVVASRFIKGKPLGPFEYRGRRRDDPEDLVPHELRRELRGLWALAAWVNHADVRGPNSHDSWVTENGRSFVRHHLIDFGALLGSSSLGPRSYQTGSEYYVDFNVFGRSLLSLGLVPFEWEGVVDPKIRSVGFIEADVFDPTTWKPDYPNPAFDDRTPRDVRWGARIVAAFTDEHIRAAIAKGQYSDPRAVEYLTRVLIQRRDKIVRAWLGAGDGRTLAAP